MKYNLDKEIDRQRFKSLTEKLLEKRCGVNCSEIKTKRTNQQNSYLHCILTEFAMQTGNTLEYTKEIYFKRYCNAEIFIEIKYDTQIRQQIEIVRSSTDLDTKEMTTAIERFRNWASAEAGIYLPAPHEEEWLQQIQIEAEQHRNYL